MKCKVKVYIPNVITYDINSIDSDSDHQNNKNIQTDLSPDKLILKKNQNLMKSFSPSYILFLTQTFGADRKLDSFNKEIYLYNKCARHFTYSKKFVVL
jgi:hypothetical protein